MRRTRRKTAILLLQDFINNPSEAAIEQLSTKLAYKGKGDCFLWLCHYSSDGCKKCPFSVESPNHFFLGETTYTCTIEAYGVADKKGPAHLLPPPEPKNKDYPTAAEAVLKCIQIVAELQSKININSEDNHD